MKNDKVEGSKERSLTVKEAFRSFFQGMVGRQACNPTGVRCLGCGACDKGRPCPLAPNLKKSKEDSK